MFKMKDIIKHKFLCLIATLLVCLSFPFNVFAAGEPSNGNYKIKSVSTGQYLTIKDGQVSLSPNGTVFKVEDTEPSSAAKWYSITYGDKALAFWDKNAKASLTNLIPGSLNNGNPNYYAYTCQRFTFGKVRSGYNIRPIAFGNNTDNRLLTVENGNLYLRKANGSKSQVFTVEWQY